VEVPTVERGFLVFTFCSMAMAGGMPFEHANEAAVLSFVKSGFDGIRHAAASGFVGGNAHAVNEEKQVF